MRAPLLIAAVVVVLGGAYFLNAGDSPIDVFGSRGASESVTYQRLAHSVEEVPVLERKEPRTPPEGAKAYRNEFLWMQLFYPASMEARETREEGGARTIVFRDPETGYEFQIFAVPYAEDRITEERFRLDNPSGIVVEQRETRVGGDLATAFYGSNKAIGETYEVWVISHGFLFEVSTYKQLKDLLDDIVATWEWL